jgi:imidazolonepropionase-like amidohydrolase
MPPDVRERMKCMNENFNDVEVKADMRRMNSRSRHIVGEMNKAGVKILAGTDNGVAPYVFHGFSLHHELKLLVESGLTPMEALQSATFNAAECVGRLDSLGTIEEGKIADLILLEENPLLSIENTEKINSVFYNGKYFDRSKLDEILNTIEILVQGK